MVPKILWIGDHRDSRSWGSRGTSIALGQELIKYGRLAGLGRSWAKTPAALGPLTAPLRRSRGLSTTASAGEARTPSRALGRQPWKTSEARRIIKNIVRSSLALTGNYTDFVDIDPHLSLKRFMKAARRNGDLTSLKKQFEAADVVVINGEGSMIFSTPPRRDLSFKLFAVELAAELAKPVFYINALASDCPRTGTNRSVEAAVRRTLPKCSVISVRDPVSQDRLQDLGIEPIRLTPDAMYTWGQRYADLLNSSVGHKTPELYDSWPESDQFLHGWSDWPAEYVCLGGASRYPSQDTSGWPAFFESLVQRIRAETGLPVVLIDSSGDSFLSEVAQRTDCILIRPLVNVLMGTYILANARVLVSGRFHPSIMASLGGTPCVFLECGAHKTLSLQQQLEYPHPRVFPFRSTQDNLTEIIDELKDRLAGGEHLRERIRRVAARLGAQTEAGIRQAMSPFK